ncbi:Rv0361 family membrane protein [Dactylosporangium darangshiense]|uniref:DUF4878 domain-containing protein n=1 Tax=Dactylosporangium darangshiense TaxID=579108 RepID=A0ABP8DJ79_9ACTN
MAYGYQVPQPPKSNTLRTVLIVVGSVLVLCCGAVVVGGFFLFRNIGDSIGPAQDAAVTFVTRLEQDDVDGAYGLLCGDTREQYTATAFADRVRQQPKIRSHSVAGVSVVGRPGGASATVSMRLTLDSGFAAEHAFPMVKEGNAWKVCGQPY